MRNGLFPMVTDAEIEATMRTRLLVRPHTTRYNRESPFSYTCQACSRCCYDKMIQLNPYEVARLAGNRGISTTEFLARYTNRGGTTLKRNEDGACVLLTAEGCSVYPDRPLVCRLYPLGRRVTTAGDEWFTELAPHPQTAGLYGTAGPVAEYLTAQGAEPYIEAVDRYLNLLGQMAAVLSKHVKEEGIRQEIEQAINHVIATDDAQAPVWLDMDPVVQEHCRAEDHPVPSDLSVRTDLHIRAIRRWLESHP